MSGAIPQPNISRAPRKQNPTLAGGLLKASESFHACDFGCPRFWIDC